MQYIVTKQIAVEADTPEDAAYKSKTEGKSMAISVSLRPDQTTAQTESLRKLEQLTKK